MPHATSALTALFALGLFLPATNAIAQRRPLAPPPGVRVERNLAYVENGHRNQVLDLYLPEAAADEPLPLVVWIHGGAWRAGSHANTPLRFLLREGFALASIEYRFSSHATWPAQAHDCKAAVRWLRAHAEEYHIDPERIGVGGSSAGGHLAAFLGTSGNAADLEGDLGNAGQSSAVQAVLDLYGPSDLLLMGAQSGPNSRMDHDAADSPESLLIGGPVQQTADVAKAASPITYVDSADPPFLLLHGDSDPVVPHEQSVILTKALTDAGVEATLKSLPGAGHGGPEFASRESRRMILEFFARHLQP